MPMVLGCILEIKGKTLLLKSPHTLDRGFGGIKLELTDLEDSFLRTSSHSVGKNYANGEKQSIILASCNIYEP